MKRKDREKGKERKWILIYPINDSKQESNIQGGDILMVEDSNQIREESKEENQIPCSRRRKLIIGPMVKGIIWTAEAWSGKWAALLDTSNISIFQDFETRWKLSTKNEKENLFKGEEKGIKNIEQHKARDNKIKNRAQANHWIYLP